LASLSSKLAERSATVVVSGVGYAGLPLAVALARTGFSVIGLDTDADKISALNRGEAYVRDVPAAELARVVTQKRLRGTTDTRALAEADAVLICVPTPLDRCRRPDLAHVVGATDAVARHQHADMLVILESTTYPGTTHEVLVPKLTTRFTLGRDVFVAYSPERTDPGNVSYGPHNTPKVVAGETPACLELASMLYGSFVERLVPVSSTAAAEMVKLLENTFRAVNVGLANEMAVISRRLGLDPFEIVRAAATKPFGFMPFEPGPGVGGHCIALDPSYLAWRLERLDCRARFIELAAAVNGAMPAYVVSRVADALNKHGKPVRHARVLVYGVAYKRDVADARESPARAIIAGLVERGAHVAYMDPHVPSFASDAGALQSVAPADGFGGYDAVVVVTDHSELDRARLVGEAALVVDARGALAGVPAGRARVYGL
jgi:UDP-N-acetyl-D-glucosamine dehydrogenase